MKKKQVKKIDSNIKSAFELIDNYLPHHYTGKVLEIVPTATRSNIRTVRMRKEGDPLIIAALKQVAMKNKSILD
ncbi:hypothetical protein [Chryseobacterium oncorhynchi]|uniref:Uncharacterized protein n=1 Tax=Chryseobacterium oncorhynchi TaxID=741074 RepID=A0A316X1B9_9FLAO|nr:hypothetical protein [Chryseobacterium oncorhynchi]PWN67632.1 hypothetical protein C1638_003305 [Chryseobacterium oncorhynchi]